MLITTAALLTLPLRAGEPVLKLEVHEPLSLVTATAFGPDGRLFVAGFDKVVRSWRPDAEKGWRPVNSYRVPIGPGIAGALNDVAVSGDGRWLATGGNGWFRRMADFRTDGTLHSRSVLDEASKREQGAVYLFDREANASTPLFHHTDAVIVLAFEGRTLVSLAWEFEEDPDMGEYSVAVWDAPTKQLLAHTRLPGVPGPNAIRPGVALRRLGPAPNDVAVVAAFSKELPVHIWRPQRAADWTALKVGSMATSVLPGPGSAASVGCLVQFGDRWGPALVSVSLDGDAPAVTQTQPLPIDGLPPGAVVGAAAAPGGSRSTAFIYRTLQAPREDWLCVLGQGNALSYRQRLRSAGTGTPPRVAISPDGLRAAVASPQGGEFDVYALNDPAAGPVRFSDRGARFTGVRFVEKNGELGLSLTTSGEQAGGGRVFDPAAMKWDAPRDGWREVEHQAGKAILVNRLDEFTLQCTTAEGQAPIRLKKNTEVTALQGLRPEPAGPPLLAVALVEAGQAELRIYRADTGEQVRRCTAHSTRIAALAASADGGLLLSASEDRTVAVWNVADLGEMIGAPGLFQGLALDGDRRVRTSGIPELQAGDVIVGRADGGALRPFASPFEVYGAARGTKPGATLPLVVERGGQRLEVAVPVVQGMDERKPLAQLYCRENGEWIAWSPMGPYDSNSESAEEWIGWHFNPEGNAPVRFALGGQYRQQYRRPGLLRRLLQTRNLAAALDAWRRLDAEPPNPNIALSVSPLDRTRGDAWVAAAKEVHVALRVTNPDFPLERLASLKATVDGEPVVLEQVRPNEYRGRADLKRPGRHVVRLAAETSAPLPRHFEDERVVLFAPPKPSLAPTEAWAARSRANRQADGTWTAPSQAAGEFRLQASLAADPAFGPMNAAVSVDGEPIRASTNLGDLRLPLRVGENRIVVSAVPKEPTEGVESAAQMVVVVRRTEPPETFAPPVITVERVEVGRERKPQPMSAAGTATVGRTLVRVVGRATSKEAVAQLEVDGRPAAGFAPAKDAAFIIEKTLTPGRNRLRLVAKGASGVESRQELSLECRPELPAAAVVVPDALREHRWSPQGQAVQTTVAFSGAGERLPVVAVLRRNGAVVARAERSADDAAAWNVSVPLVPGENRLTVDVESSWAKAAGQAATVFVRRPPIVTRVVSSPVGARPFADLTAEVDALDGWQAAELLVDGRAHQEVTQERQGPPSAAGVVRWKVVARNVPLRQGLNQFSIAARNAEGESAPGLVGGLVYAPPPPPRAVVTWLSPHADENRDRPELDVHLRIESTTPLSSMSLILGQAAAVSPPATPVKVVDGPGVAAVYEVRRRIELKPGRSALSVRVLNEGGETRAERAVNFVPRPATVRLLALESGGEVVEPRRASDGAAAFDAVRSGRQTLVGEVAFTDANAPDLTAPASLRVLVNGLQQQTVELGPAEGGVRRFKTPVTLNRRTDNHLFAEVVGLSIDADCNAQGVVARCETPMSRQRLHLVLIGVGEEDESKLREEAMQAFWASVDANPSAGPGKGAFEKILQRHAVCGYVTAPTIREAVDRLRMELVEGNVRQDASDVVVFYFRGQAAAEQRRLKLLTSEPAWMPRSKFDAGDLASRFADVPGAQLLLLDVSRHETGEELGTLERRLFKRPNACLLGFRRPPKEAPLLFSAVGKAIPKVTSLGELRKALASTPLPAGAALFDPPLPEPLERLFVGRGE